MKKLLVISVLFFSTISFGQEMMDAPIEGIGDIPEKVKVEGPRIFPGASLPPMIMGSIMGGPISTGGSANPGQGKGGGSLGPHTSVKNKKDKEDVNQKNIPKAKEGWAVKILKETSAAVIKGADSITSFLDAWKEKDLNADGKLQGSVSVTSPSGWKVDIEVCAGTSASTSAPGKPAGKEPCSEFRITPVIVENESGQLEAQFIFSITKVDACFTNVSYERKCIGLDNYTFVAADKEELYGILNEVAGGNYFH